MHWCVFFEAEVGACRLFFLSVVPLLALYRWRWGKLPWSKHRWSVFVADGSVCVFLSMAIRAAGDSLILIRLFLGPSADLQTVADIHKWIVVRAHSTVNNLSLSVCLSVCLRISSCHRPSSPSRQQHWIQNCSHWTTFLEMGRTDT